MWPFSASYPERRVEEVDGKTYDYIIVGGGTSGCVLASRLSEDPAVSVLVLEKGHVNDHFLSRIPLLSQNYAFPGLQAVSRLSEPGVEVFGRRTRLWTAEGVGGASRINGMILTRGVPGGYNEWSQSFGLTDWSWDDVEPYFVKMENAQGHPKAKHRGHDGPLVTRQVESPLGCYPYIQKATQAVGLPFERDANDPAASAQGYFKLDLAINEKGERLSSYRAWLDARTATERKSHLTVCTGVVASRLEVDEKQMRVTGVYLRKARHGSSSRDFYVKARKEIILCGGAICTPQLLMLSGIGPARQLEAHGITAKHHLPAVGENLSDHNSIPISMTMPWKDTLHVVMGALGFLWQAMLYLLFRRGILASSSTPNTIFMRTTSLDEAMTVQAYDKAGSDNLDASLPGNVPDTELMVIPLAPPGIPVRSGSFFTWYIALVQPQSRGRVELASSDAETHPRIVYPLLSDRRDVVAARKAVRFAMHLSDEFSASGYPHPTPLVFAPGMDLAYLDSLFAGGRITKPESRKLDWRTVSDEDIDQYVRRVCGTCLHFTSTCRMSNSPEDGVVDQRLRVHGFANLRIADASVLPKITSAHTMAPVVMIAERCADFLREAYKDERE